MTFETPEGRFGTGAIQSLPDERDWFLAGSTAQRLATGAAELAAFRLGERPPITNQLDTPHCVPHACGYEQNWQDQQEHGRFYNFNKPLFFQRIGGTPNGASVRVALDQMRSVGYPEADSTPDSAKHKITGYALVEKSVQAIKAAIVARGGVVVVGPWYENWTVRSGALQVLPRPSGGGSGHAWWAIGWDEYGLLGQNSWGTLWGDGGLFRMPWAYVVGYMWEVWTTLDEQTLTQIATATIKERGTYLHRPARVIGDDAPKLDYARAWGQARNAGIYRFSTDSIVAKPWDKPFRYRGRRNGARHSEGPRGETWVLLGIAGTEVAVPAPQVVVSLA